MRRPDPIGDIERLKHILEAISNIEELRRVKDPQTFHELALERLFAIIGEACRALSTQLRQQYPEVPWVNIIALRNIIVHEYDEVEITTLWEIAEHKIPSLKDWIEGILATNNNQ